MVRGLMVVLMLISLVMSAAIPEAFSGKAAGFAAAYVAIQVARSAFMVGAFRGQRMGRNYAQLLAWTGIAGLAWLAGVFVHGDMRPFVWIIALIIDYGAPLHGFWLPGLGSTPIQEWTLAGGHLAERNQLVLLIALGESVLAVGRTFSELPAHAATVAAFVTGFAETVSLWWMVGGVIVVAVAIDVTIAHPAGTTTTAEAAVILGGPALYLAGNALFNFTLTGRAPWSRLLAIGLLGLIIALAITGTPLLLTSAATAVVLTLALATGSPVTGPVTPARHAWAQRL